MKGGTYFRIRLAKSSTSSLSENHIRPMNERKQTLSKKFSLV